MTLKNLTVSFLMFFLATIAAPVASAADSPKLGSGAEYPHRTSFPDVAIITTQELSAQRDRVEIVDVRSTFEYNTLHIKNAYNIPVTDKDFETRVTKLAKESGKPLVFYCNGKTCKKSYEAARQANYAKVNKCYAYDAGIFDWAKANPERTVLLGRSPVKLEDLIDEDKFKTHLLSQKEFDAKVGPSAVIVDVRDKVQRDILLFPFQEERVTLDQLDRLDGIIRDAKAKGKTLLIYDKVGHQVQWLQYHLEAKGVKDYYFLKGGEEGYYQAKLGVRMGLKK
ncbi:MAG: rhodanese-like domain-containing protein [Bacteroidota bacterium]